MRAIRHLSTRHARSLQQVYRVFSRVAPVFAPVLRGVGARRAEPVLRVVERASKGLLFDCQMCGQCVLSSTGMTCPMNCAKQMRNGPCGGVRADARCEVKPDMRCVWVEAIKGSKRIDNRQTIPVAPLLPAIDVRRRGRSSWIDVIEGRPETDIQSPVTERTVDESTPSNLERACRSGRMVVTVEVAPPDSANPQHLLDKANTFKGLVDAINITDGAGGNCHMSSVAASAVLAANGFDPVYQVACRDRNRIAIQGDIIGAATLGVKNILCLTGDDVSQGDHPQAKPVFDLDAVSLLHIVRGMCDRGEYASGRKLQAAPDLFIGATANPFVPPFNDRIANLEKKVNAGARFIQTQFCFDLPMFESFMAEIRQRELHRRAHIIVGVGTLASARALAWMGANVPGVHVPPAMIKRIEKSTDQKQAAKQICIEHIRALAQIEGLAGVHVMGHRNEDVLAEIIIESGLRQQPRLKTV